MYRKRGGLFLKPLTAAAKTLVSAPLLVPRTALFSSYSGAGNRRPKKKVYHRVSDLDNAVDLQKKPTLILRLRAILAASRSGSILIRDLEKEVGFVQKWTFLSIIQRYPSVFKVSGGGSSNPSPISVRLSDKAQRISDEEPRFMAMMEPILVRNLRKLLMMSLDCQIPMEKIELIELELGLPQNFKRHLIPKYPQFFSLRNLDGVEHLCLENWDSALAITAREEKLHLENIPPTKTKMIPKDGNFSGPFAFKLKFAPGFRPNKSYLQEVVKWQKMAFPSPYLNARKVEPDTPQARKRTVAVLHEFLSLTMEKRLTSYKLDAFHREFRLPSRLLLCLVKNHGIFYITNKGARSTVFLKEAYDGSHLIEKCPLLEFSDKFVELIGRKTSPDVVTLQDFGSYCDQLHIIF